MESRMGRAGGVRSIETGNSAPAGEVFPRGSMRRAENLWAPSVRLFIEAVHVSAAGAMMMVETMEVPSRISTFWAAVSCVTDPERRTESIRDGDGGLQDRIVGVPSADVSTEKAV